MTPDEKKVADLEEQIAALPRGWIAEKIKNGSTYFYHRWSENGMPQERYLTKEDAVPLKEKIEKRKALEKELRQLRSSIPKKRRSTVRKKTSTDFLTNVYAGNSLRSFASSAARYKKRECYQALHDYLYGAQQDRVFVLYGLRRTGKTTMIRQALLEMNEDDFFKAAFIQVTSRDKLSDINHDMKILESQGFRYVFIDEVTLMEDFIDGAALFSDIFAAMGMKIVLSGTDSLSFLFTKSEQLYDRCIMLHTTFIPYREFETVLGVHGIDEYIRFGGTMSLGGKNYNQSSTFSSKARADEYTDSSIAHNIQHSLRLYQHEGHFRHLQDLYEKDELTSVINRVVEDINHRFTVEVLTRDFKSSDLSISAGNLRRDRENPNDILDRIDVASVTERLHNLLEIENKNEQSVTIEEAHTSEIREYLELLDLLSEISIVSLPYVNTKGSRTVITQPGLRYAQVDALIQSLLLDQEFTDLSFVEREAVLERIRNEVKGRMMEDIVLLETATSFPQKQVFVLQFAIGEFDMVVFDPQAGNCSIYEIKHSDQIVEQQYRHLIDEQKCADTEHRYGPITGKYVIYRGIEAQQDGIVYLNVESYLKSLG